MTGARVICAACGEYWPCTVATARGAYRALISTGHRPADDPRQPALAGAEAVRETEIPHPAESLPPAPFRLTPPAATEPTQLRLGDETP